MVGSRYDAPHCDYSDKGRLLERLLAIIGSLKILIIKFLPKMVKTLLREDQQLYIR